MNNRCIDFVLHHKNGINELVKLEMEYCVAYEKLHRRYYSKLTSRHYEENQNEPLTRIVWWCWLQGEEAAPPLCKACLASMREHLPEYEIRVVTLQNMLEFVHLPQFILDKYERGIISRTHFSDILRTLLLIEYGGVWIDSTVYCTGYNVPIFEYPLFVYQNWKLKISQTMVASSWLISARKNDPILCAVRDLLFAYWNENDSLLNYFLFHFFFKMAAEHYFEHWKAVPRFSNTPPHILQREIFDVYDEERFKQIKQMADFHKLSYKCNTEGRNLTGSYYDKIVMHSEEGVL